MKKGILKSFADSRKMKYASISIAFTAVIIALVVILNSIISVLSSNFNWYLDMTEEQTFSLSDSMKSLLDDLDSNVEIEIIFATSKDNVELDFSNLENGGAMAYVYATATLLDTRYDNISVSYHDIIREPQFFRNYFDRSETEAKPNENSVIITRKNEDGTYGEYRVKDSSQFYVFSGSDNSLYGYNGELVFAQSVLSLALNETPVIYFTVGHSEISFDSWEYDENGELKTYTPNEAAAALLGLFELSGFKVLPIDCVEQDIPDDARMVVINQPRTDFLPEEIDKLQNYLTNVGSVMCFTGYNATNLEGLYSFAEVFGGVTVNAGERLKDNTSSVGGDAYSLRARVPQNSATAVYFESLTGYASARAKFSNTAYLTINPDFMSENGFETLNGLRHTMPILTTTPNAQIGENGQRGTYSLLSVTASEMVKDNEYQYSYLIMCPSEGFADNVTLSSNSYPNRGMILSLIHSTTSLQVAVDLTYKPFVNYSLDISDATAQGLTAMFALLMPAIAIACGAFVIIRRKRR